MCVSLVSRWRENDKGDNGMRGKPGTVQQISWHLPYDWGKPRKTSVTKPLGALSSMTSHCFKLGPFPPNEVCRVILLALLAIPIGPSQKSVLKNLRSEDPRSATLKKFSSWELNLLGGRLWLAILPAASDVFNFLLMTLQKEYNIPKTTEFTQ